MTLHRFTVELEVDDRQLDRYLRSSPPGLGFLTEDVATWNLGQLNEAVEQDVATASVAPLELLDSDEL